MVSVLLTYTAVGGERMGPKECPLPLQVYNLFHPLLLNNSVLIITVSLINQSTSIIIYLLYFLIKSFTYLKRKKKTEQGIVWTLQIRER